MKELIPYDTNFLMVNISTISTATLGTIFIGSANLFIYLTLVMLADLVTGVIASLRVGDTISSRKFGMGALVKLSTLIVFAIIISAVSLLTFGTSEEPITFIFWYFAAAEIMSVVGNWDTILHKKRSPELEIYSIFISQIRNRVLKFFGKDKEKGEQ